MGLDYYRVLFIDNEATDDEVKQAYKKMSLLHHPKRQKIERPLTPSYRLREQIVREQQRRLDSIQMFHIVGEAYDVLSNPLYRAIYDTFGERGLKEGVPSPHGYIQPYAYHGDPNKTFRDFFGTENPFADLLGASCVPVDFFAGTDENTGFKAKEAPLHREVWLTLEELYTGCIKKVMICKKYLSPDGNSVYQKSKVLTFNISPGTAVGTQFIFPSEGDQSPNTQPADIIFHVCAKKHQSFIREGDNLIYNTKITLCQALTGGTTLQILALDGRRFNVNVVHIISPGYEKIVPKEGFTILNEPGRRGDLIIRFSVDYPHTLTQNQKKLTKEALDCSPNEDDLKLLKLKQDDKKTTCYKKLQPITLNIPAGCYCPPEEEEEEEQDKALLFGKKQQEKDQKQKKSNEDDDQDGDDFVRKPIQTNNS